MTEVRLDAPEVTFALRGLEYEFPEAERGEDADWLWCTATLGDVSERLTLTGTELARLAAEVGAVLAGERSATDFVTLEQQLELGVVRAGRAFRFRVLVRSSADAWEGTAAADITRAQLERLAAGLAALSRAYPPRR